MLDRLKSLFSEIENKDPSPSGPPEFLVAGLGNPGAEYEGTRHNAGFMALDRLAVAHGTAVTRIRFKSLCGDTVICGKRVLLLKPQTFMNLSGEALRDAAAFYKLPAERMIVIYDDISLPVGKIRVRPKGSDGGHRGIRSIIYLTGTDVFPRIKIGVGAKPRPDYDLASWVLGKIPKESADDFQAALDHAAAAVSEILTNGTADAMNKYNG